MDRKYRVSLSQEIESFIQNLQHQPIETQESRRFEGRAAFRVETDVDTESVLHDVHANPDVFRRLEAEYRSLFSQPALQRSPHQGFELAWSVE